MAAPKLTTRPIYDKSFPPLKRLSWAWRFTATVAGYLMWGYTIPWLIIRMLAPTFNLQDKVNELEDNFLQVARPIVNAIQDTAYSIFKNFDSVADWAIQTGSHVYDNNKNTVIHTVEDVLSFFEIRLKFLKHEGLNGIFRFFSFDLAEPTSRKIPLVNAPIPGEGKMM
ncbi:hypothetical protein Vretifemale_13126 [Volvox reticuliferus]|uniref:Uncharacterized protein n=1 Tax=Volvox reticuliferus TaxID=1737510 RepID=A0A8J4CQ98_9CHLO|nr:hypothetical protein Vretifemale_13126 [Volvox reticuliferus]